MPDDPNDYLNELLGAEKPSPEKINSFKTRVLQNAAAAGVAPDIAEDFTHVIKTIESGGRQYSGANLLKSDMGATGVSQVLPDRSGGLVRTIKGRKYDLSDIDQNIQAGLHLFSAGGADPVARRLEYFGGQKAREYYEKHGAIPPGGEWATDKKTGKKYLRTSYHTYINKTLPQTPKSGTPVPLTPKDDSTKVDVDQVYDALGIGALVSKPALDTSATRLGKTYNTVLSPAEENQFQLWKTEYAPEDTGEDYDLRGAFKAGLKPAANGHWPDTFKKPSHPTFSNESQYAIGADAVKAGRWEGDRFIPSADALKGSDEEKETSPHTGLVGQIFSQGPKTISGYQGWIQANIPSRGGKARPIEVAMRDEVNAKYYLRLQDALAQNPNATKKQVRNIKANLGLDFMKDPETDGHLLPADLHLAMVTNHWHPDSLAQLPRKIQEQSRAYRQRQREAQVRADVSQNDLEWHLGATPDEVAKWTPSQKRKAQAVTAQLVKRDEARRKSGETITQPDADYWHQARRWAGLPSFQLRQPANKSSFASPLESNVPTLGEQIARASDPKIKERQVRQQVEQEVQAERAARQSGPMTPARSTLAFADQIRNPADVKKEIDERVQERLEAVKFADTNRSDIDSIKGKLGDFAQQANVLGNIVQQINTGRVSDPKAGERVISSVQNFLANSGVQAGNLLRTVLGPNWNTGKSAAGEDLTHAMRLAQQALVEKEQEDPDQGWLAIAERTLPGAGLEAAKMTLLSAVPGAGRATLPALGVLSEADKGIVPALKAGAEGELFVRGFGLTKAMSPVGKFLTWTSIPAALDIFQGEDPVRALMKSAAFGVMALAERPRVQVKDGEMVRDATVADKPRIESGEIQVVKPTAGGNEDAARTGSLQSERGQADTAYQGERAGAGIVGGGSGEPSLRAGAESEKGSAAPPPQSAVQEGNVQSQDAFRQNVERGAQVLQDSKTGDRWIDPEGGYWVDTGQYFEHYNEDGTPSGGVKHVRESTRQGGQVSATDGILSDIGKLESQSARRQDVDTPIVGLPPLKNKALISSKLTFGQHVYSLMRAATGRIFKPVSKGFVRLYRGEAVEGAGRINIPDWLKENPEYIDIKEATGRWFAEDSRYAQWYANHVRNNELTPRISYVDVPKEVAEKARVSSQPEDVRRFSSDPENEFFLPSEYAKQRVELPTIKELVRKRSRQDVALAQDTVPETPATIAQQMEALQAGRERVVLIPPDGELPKTPEGFTRRKTSVGTFVFDPKVTKAAEVQAKVKDGTWHELLGHVEPKGETTTSVVTARAPTGEEQKTSVVTPGNEEAQAAELKARYPDAKIEVGDAGQAQKVIDERSSELKQWFGRSQATNENGEPLDLYHFTTKEAEKQIRAAGFDVTKPRARRSDEGVPDGIFFTPQSKSPFSDKMDFARIRANLKIESPLKVETREDLTKWAAERDTEYAKLIDEVGKFDRKRIGEAMKSDDPAIRTQGEKKYQALIDKATIARARLTDLLKREGHDSVIIERDVGGPQVAKTYIALDPKQVLLAKEHGSIVAGVPSVPEGFTRFYRADTHDATGPQGAKWVANNPEYVSRKYGAGEMGGESVWYRDVPNGELTAEYGDHRTVSVLDHVALNRMKGTEPKLYRRTQPESNKVSVTAALEDAPKWAGQEGSLAFGPIFHAARDYITVDPVPGMTRVGLQAQAREHASARVATPFVVRDLLSKVFPDSYTDPEAMAHTIDVINKDNILGGYDTFVENALQARASGNTREAKAWQGRADAIGDAHDIARLEAEVAAARADPKISADIERWKTEVNPVLDGLYNEMKRLDPDTPREGRGRVFGARINLLPEARAAEMAAFSDLSQPMPEGVNANYRNPNVKKDPFMRAARFTGQYSTDANAVLTNVLGPRWNEVTKLRLYSGLVDSGAAVELDYGESPPGDIQGHKAVRLPIKVPETGDSGITRMVERRLYVRGDISREVRDVLNTDMPLPGNPIAKFLTAIQLAQLTDITAHLKNIHTVLAAAPATRSAFTDAVRRLPILGSVDSIGRIVGVTREVMADTPQIRAEQAEMAKLGLIRPEYPPTGIQKITRGQQFIHKVDTASRIVMNRFFNNLVTAGRVTDTPENRAGFVQQIGEYNRRLMAPLMRAARDSGLSPFIVAGRNFNRQAVRLITGAPGVEASSFAEAGKMRAVNIMSGLVAAATLPALLNVVTTGSLGGRPGTPIGAWDVGRPEDEKGKHRVIDIMQILGIRRGLRVTGTGAVIEGLREGKSWNDILGQSFEDVKNSVAHPWIGPAPGFAYTAMTGRRIDLRGGPEPPQAFNVGGGIKQVGENMRVALEAQNPLLYGVVSPLFDDESDDSYFKRIGQGLMKGPASAVGIQDLSSPAAKILADERRQRGAFTKTKDQVKASHLKSDLRGRMRAGENVDVEIDTAVEEGRLTLRQAHDIGRNKNLSALALQLKYAPLMTALKAYEVMSESQRNEVKAMMWAKRSRGYGNLKPAEKTQFDERWKKLGFDKKSPVVTTSPTPSASPKSAEDHLKELLGDP